MRDPWMEPRGVGLRGEVDGDREGESGGRKMKTTVLEHQ